MGINSGAGITTAIANFVAAFYGLYLIFNQAYEEKYSNASQDISFNADLLKRFIKVWCSKWTSVGT
ncbi:MAG: hypothetical protein U0T83_06840 [Bacteriovoracaceae bacterium]